MCGVMAAVWKSTVYVQMIPLSRASRVLMYILRMIIAQKAARQTTIWRCWCWYCFDRACVFRSRYVDEAWIATVETWQ